MEFYFQVPEVYTSVLEHLLVIQIDTFPQYSQRMQYTTCRSIIKVLVAMAARGPVLWSFTSSVGKNGHLNPVMYCNSPRTFFMMTTTLCFSLNPVHQGLIRVCSKPLIQVEVILLECFCIVQVLRC